MESVELQSLFDTYHRKLAKIDLRFKRYLYSQINWDARFIGIKGPRGVGKTTMLLQNILESYQDIDQTLYASLDDLWFASHPLMDLVDWAYQHGIMRLYLDEVHRYNQWSINLKNIYDNYPDMSIVYTSSSLLIMDNAKVDLSRRQTTYTLCGMSFREFLAYEGVLNHEAVPFDDALYMVRVTGAQLRRMLLYRLRDEVWQGVHCEFYQFSAGLQAVYVKEEHAFASLTLHGAPISDGQVLTVGLQQYHYMNFEDIFRVPMEEIARNGAPRVAATSCRDVIEEYLTAHQHLDCRAGDRLRILERRADA